MEHKNNLINEIARRAIVEVLDGLYELHRPKAMSHVLSLCVSTTLFAEARGVKDVAFDALSAAKDEAQKAINKTLAGITVLSGRILLNIIKLKKMPLPQRVLAFLVLLTPHEKKNFFFSGMEHAVRLLFLHVRFL